MFVYLYHAVFKPNPLSIIFFMPMLMPWVGVSLWVVCNYCVLLDILKLTNYVIYCIIVGVAFASCLKAVS